MLPTHPRRDHTSNDIHDKRPAEQKSTRRTQRADVTHYHNCDNSHTPSNRQTGFRCTPASAMPPRSSLPNHLCAMSLSRALSLSLSLWLSPSRFLSLDLSLLSPFSL